jgi:magnesium-transporting ATPase (P-type)
MKELDLLKKHWNETKDFPKVSTAEIEKMIHKKSSSIVMWILFISILEFLCLNLVSYFFLDDDGINVNVSVNRPESNSSFVFMIENIDYISGAISLFFIVLFYFNYRKIHVASSTKMLMKQIIKTRKTVNYYIYTNIVMILICFIIATVNIFQSNENQQFSTENYIIAISVLSIVCLLFLGVVWLYYKLVYGILIKRLMKNHKELEKIDLE